MQECFYAEILFKLSFLTKVMGNKELTDYTEVADGDTFYLGVRMGRNSLNTLLRDCNDI